MTWQEYQHAVGQLYEQAEGIGTVLRNITLPDKITGQARQIDAWIELETKGHKLGILIDAKYRRQRVDVKDVEEVRSLAEAVGANRAVLVALNGWTGPAEIKAQSVGLDLLLLTLDDALDLIVEDKWAICEACHSDCVVLDHDGATDSDGGWLWWLAGRCRHCKIAFVWCQDCGQNTPLPLGRSIKCPCGHTWRNSIKGMFLKVRGSPAFVEI